MERTCYLLPPCLQLDQLPPQSVPSPRPFSQPHQYHRHHPCQRMSGKMSRPTRVRRSVDARSRGEMRVCVINQGVWFIARPAHITGHCRCVFNLLTISISPCCTLPTLESCECMTYSHQAPLVQLDWMDNHVSYPRHVTHGTHTRVVVTNTCSVIVCHAKYCITLGRPHRCQWLAGKNFGLFY